MSAALSAGATYVICTTPRSGSWLLADCLDQTGLAGRPQEYFMNHVAFHPDWGVPHRENLGDYLEFVRAEATTENGVCGFKLHWSQLRHLATVVGSGIDDTETAFDWLAQEFAPLTVIRLSRVDKLRQALSYHRALSDQQWWRLAGDDARKRPFRAPDPEQVDHLCRLLEKHDRRWDELIATACGAVCRLTYEQLVADLRWRVCDCLLALGVPYQDAEDAAAAIRPGLVKQADERTDLWVHEYISWRRRQGSPASVWEG
jgi:LPS sulfotransferase NodH